MSQEPSPESTRGDGDQPPSALGSAQFDSSVSLHRLESADAIQRANGGRDHRAFLAEMAADLEAWFHSQGLTEEAERHRKARQILETPVDPVYDDAGNETLNAHDRLMYHYYMALGNSSGAEVHRDYLAARGESL